MEKCTKAIEKNCNNNNNSFLYSAFLNTQRCFTCAETNSKNTKDRGSNKTNKQNSLVKKLCEMSHVVEGREQGLAGEDEFEEVSFEGYGGSLTDVDGDLCVWFWDLCLEF